MTIEPINEDEIVDINLGPHGNVSEPKNDKIALIDADTIAFIACLAAEEINLIMPREFYIDSEWEGIINNPTYVEGAEEYYTINLDNALEKCEAKLGKILELTGCQTAELHFSRGKDNFRYALYPEYKANRKERPPVGLKEVKKAFAARYEGSEIHTKWEADDIVVCKKREAPDKYTLCAIDKDVVYALPGRHFNYFEANYMRGETSVLVDMQFVEVSEKHAKYWPYMQIVNGDTSDNIIGPNRIGPQTMIPYFGGEKPKPAVKKLQDAIDNLPDNMTHRDLWRACVDCYEAKGLSEFDAVLNMNLVSMNMLTTKDGAPEGHKIYVSEGEYKIVEWRPDAI